jgi:hypothetical protein
MCDIYRKAKHVVVWLGPEAKNSSLAIELLGSIASDLVPGYRSAELVSGSKTERLFNDPQSIIAKSIHWVAINDLLHREWFTRLWIYQEIHLAKSAVVVTGNRKLHFDYFDNALFRLGTEIAAGKNLAEFIELALIRRVATLLQAIQIPHDFPIDETTFLSCRDPKDRIYAILGLGYPVYREEIVPDYTKPIEEVYKDFFFMPP